MKIEVKISDKYHGDFDVVVEAQNNVLPSFVASTMENIGKLYGEVFEKRGNGFAALTEEEAYQWRTPIVPRSK